MSSLQAGVGTSSIHHFSGIPNATIPHSYSAGADTPVPNPTGTEEPSSASRLLLSAVKDARQIVKLVQCRICSKLLQGPTTLPCGNSLCRQCIPETHVRSNISWPATANRLQGFECPFEDCEKEHALDDCAIDVTLNKVLTIVRAAIKLDRDVTEPQDASTHIAVQDPWAAAGISSLEQRQPESVVLRGGRIAATYAMAGLGKLDYSAEVSYAPVGAPEETIEQIDNAVLIRLKDSTRAEVDCQVCYAIFLDPITTACGHTFCRTCIQRVLDHSDLCPICRRSLSIQPQAASHRLPSNERLVKIINGLWADQVALRAHAYRLEQQANYNGFDIPLFVCTLSFPHMPTFLHVFEPRYRLMIRRAMEGNGTFGMVLHTPSSNPEEPEFAEFGTLLRIVNIEYFVDGRSLVETRGISRFRVTRHGEQDGYVVANIKRIDDISLAEEEAVEAYETSQYSVRNLALRTNAAGADPGNPERPSSARSPPAPISLDDLDAMSTRDLVDFATDFVTRMRIRSVSWLLPRIIAIYGECPSDPVQFPWWLASLLPVKEDEKYRLMSTTSVRQRMKICCRWIIEWEASRRTLMDCSVL